MNGYWKNKALCFTRYLQIIGSKAIDKKRNNIFRKVSGEPSDEIGLVSFLFNK